MFYVDFLARFLRSILERLKEKYDWEDLKILISPVRNNFIKNLFTAKSREFTSLLKSLLFMALISRPYNKIGIY